MYYEYMTLVFLSARASLKSKSDLLTRNALSIAIEGNLRIYLIIGYVARS